MTASEFTTASPVLCGDRAGVGLGYTLEATAVRLAEGISELRASGGIPEQAVTVTTVLPQEGVLEVRVDGLIGEDLVLLLGVAGTLFDLASRYNVMPVDSTEPPLFTQRIVLAGPDEHPVLELVGAAVGLPAPSTRTLTPTPTSPPPEERDES